MAGKPIYDEKMHQRITVRLTPDLIEYATSLGKGKPSTGLRLALEAHRARLDPAAIQARHREYLDAQERRADAEER